MRYLTLCLLAVFMASSAPPPTAHAACIVDVASWDVLWIRGGPSTRYQKVGSIPANGCGVRVDYSQCRGNWCRVYYRGVAGWAHTRYIQ